VAHLQPDGTWLEINDNAWGDPGHREGCSSGAYKASRSRRRVNRWRAARWL